MGTTTTAARPGLDPDRLLAAWRALLGRHAHLHNPQAAAMLGVPEAALIAARVGCGATSLRPDVEALLAPVASWGRTLFAVGNPLGVSLAFSASGRVDSRDGAWIVSTASQVTRIDAGQVHHAFWFEDRDVHGRTHSVQLFDAEGDAVAKVFVFAKSRLAGVRAHLDPFVQNVQRREFTGARLTANEVTAVEPPGGRSPVGDPGGCAQEGAPAVFARAFAGLNDLAAPVRVELESGSARIMTVGQVHKVSSSGGGVHVNEPDFRWHLFPGRATRTLLVGAVTGGVAGLDFHASGSGRLRLAPIDVDSRWARWVAGVLGGQP